MRHIHIITIIVSRAKLLASAGQMDFWLFLEMRNFGSGYG